MTCEQVGTYLQEYVEGEILDTQLLDALETHTNGCDSCRRRILARRKLIHLLKRAFEVRRGSSAITPRN